MSKLEEEPGTVQRRQFRMLFGISQLELIKVINRKP